MCKLYIIVDIYIIIRIVYKTLKKSMEIASEFRLRRVDKSWTA